MSAIVLKGFVLCTISRGSSDQKSRSSPSNNEFNGLVRENRVDWKCAVSVVKQNNNNKIE